MKKQKGNQTWYLCHIHALTQVNWGVMGEEKAHAE